MRRDREGLSVRARMQRTAIGVLATTLAVAACTAAKPSPEPATQPAAPSAGAEARFRSLDSAVSGVARIIDRGDGATLTVALINPPEGPYRVALHEIPNCSSPNGFSAGPHWAPAASGKPPKELVPILLSHADNNAQATVHLRGVHVGGPDGVLGRSIVVYAGSTVTDARPDVPNNRVACGVFQPTQPFRF
jgi:Cu/Zn superoxide dismutase